MAKGNRNIKNNPTGQTPAPRLKGNSSTTNVGKGTSSSAAKQDKPGFKRGDSAGPSAGADLKAKFERSSSKLSKMPPEMPNKFSRGE